ncbi:MAG: hypothetical protein COA77_02020 [Thaumarchaeota archaeon]|nr:MAG: hypothetical protein COA77_02020 [Nitrososphaerota archaeon]
MLFVAKFVVFVMVVCLLFPASSVYGHGLGIETISSIDVQGKSLTVTVEMPMYFENESEQITITAIEDETDETAKNVTFLIGLFHNGEMIFRNYFFAEDGILPINVKPTQEGKITIHGEQDSLLGAWHPTESNPIEITGSLFNSGGLYTFEIEVRTIDEPTNIIENSKVYKVDLTLIEQPTIEWQSMLAVFEDVLDHEKSITASINSIQSLSVKEEDFATMNFLQWFIDEQIEEEENAANILKQLQLIGDNGYGLLMLDKELAVRKFVEPVAK